MAVRLGSEAAVLRGSKKYVLLYDEKSFEKFQQRSSFFSSGTVYRPAMLIEINLFKGFFSMISIGSFL